MAEGGEFSKLLGQFLIGPCVSFKASDWLGGAKRIVQVVELEDNQVFGGASLKWVVIPGQRQRTIGRHISLNLHTLTPSAANPANAHFNPILTRFAAKKAK